MEFLIAIGWSQLYSDVSPITASNYKVQYHGFCRTLSLCRYGRNAILRNCYSFLIGIDVSLCSDTVELYRLPIIDLFQRIIEYFRKHPLFVRIYRRGKMCREYFKKSGNVSEWWNIKYTFQINIQDRKLNKHFFLDDFLFSLATVRNRCFNFESLINSSLFQYAFPLYFRVHETSFYSRDNVKPE